MKLITETMLKQELKTQSARQYTVPDGALLSPSAKEYLQSLKKQDRRQDKTPMENEHYKYIDYETGAYYRDKPEHMTGLVGNLLVAKNHPRIIFRGLLDSLHSEVVLAQTELKQCSKSAENSPKNAKIIDDLSEIARVLHTLMSIDCGVKTEINTNIIGYSFTELREISHNPLKHFGIKNMQLPSADMGYEYAKLNYLRAKTRELECSANGCFSGRDKQHEDILKELNRLSSALHIMMCKQLSGEYK